jgi:hypothetical protein
MANEEKDSVLFSVAGENGHWTVRVQVLEEMERVLIASSPGVNCPESRRATLCEFLNRLNWDIMQGNFDMDMNDGETRFRTCLDCAGQPLTESLLDLFFCLHFTTLDHYFLSLMRVIYGQLSAEEAFRLGTLPEQDSLPVQVTPQRRRSDEKPRERRADSHPDTGRKERETEEEEGLNRELSSLLEALGETDREELSEYLQKENNAFSTGKPQRPTSPHRHETKPEKHSHGKAPQPPEGKKP